MGSLERRVAEAEQAAGLVEEPVVYSYGWGMPDGSFWEFARAERRGDTWRRLEPEDNPLLRAYRIRSSGGPEASSVVADA